jgi:uncharacterized RDD family membrane protein YckC
MAQTAQIKYAGFWRRFLAFFVDTFILNLIGMVLQTLLGKNPIEILLNMNSLEELQEFQNSASTTVISLIGLIVGLLYYSIFYVNYDGATLGKRLMAIKVIRDDGSKVTYPVIFIRYLSSFISSFIMGIGYLMVFWDRKKQALHDKIAKTVVVKTEKKPKTFLAILLSLVAFLFFSFYMALSIYQSYRFSGELLKKNTGGSAGSSIRQYKGTMNLDAKVHYDKSMQLFEDMKAVQTDPKKVAEINDENIAELKKATELDPNNAIIWYELGNAYTWMSSSNTAFEEGIAAYKKAEELDPTNVIFINGLGDMLIQAGKYEDAILQFQKTFRITEESGYAHLSTANAYAQLGINDMAKEHYQKAIDIFTNQNSDGSYDDLILQARKGLAVVSK